jgi:hypothetical protein
MDGRYSTLSFELYDMDGSKAVDHGAQISDSFLLRIIFYSNLTSCIPIITGFYFFSDGGYPKLKYFICPFKWPEVGKKCQNWSSHLESIQKNIERFWIHQEMFWEPCESNHLQEAHHLDQLFNACCVLHIIILDYNGADEWRTNVY